MRALQGKRVVLTGISRGIGLETAGVFLREGADVIGVSRDPHRLDAAMSELRQLGPVSAVQVDLGRPDSAQAILAAALERWGAVDLLINNAAIGGRGASFEEETPDDLVDTVQVNVFGPHYLTHALLPLLLRGREPRIINVSSGAGMMKGRIDRLADMASYRLSKLALTGMSLLWANALRGRVSVLALNPGRIGTDMGGPHAAEDPPAGARRLLDAALLPWEVTGVFVDGARVVPWE